MNYMKAKALVVLTAIAGAALIQNPTAILAAPTAEVAKRCMHYSYVVYPYKRPGAVRMSGDRQAYFKDCIAKNGDVPAPIPVTDNAAATTKR